MGPGWWNLTMKLHTKDPLEESLCQVCCVQLHLLTCFLLELIRWFCLQKHECYSATQQGIFIEWQQILHSKNIAGIQQKVAVSPGLIKAKNNCKARNLQDHRKDCIIRSIQTQKKPNSHTLLRENRVWQLKGWPILNIYPLTSFTLPHLHSKSLLISIWDSVIILSKPSTVYLWSFYQSSDYLYNSFGKRISSIQCVLIGPGQLSIYYISTHGLADWLPVGEKKPPFMHQPAMDGEVTWNWLGIIYGWKHFVRS